MEWKSKVFILLMIDMFYSFFLTVFWYQTFETYHGGICSYWRCIETNFNLFPLLLIILAGLILITLVVYMLEK